MCDPRIERLRIGVTGRKLNERETIRRALAGRRRDNESRAFVGTHSTLSLLCKIL